MAQASQDAIRIREQVTTEHERDFQEKQEEWNEKYRSIVEYRDDLDKKLEEQKALNVKLSDETSSAKRKLDELESSLDSNQKEKEALEKKLKNIAREKATVSEDILRLKEQLKSKDADIQARDQDLKSLQQQLEVLQNDKISREGSIESLKNQLEEHRATIENMQEESQNQASAREKNLQKALEFAKQELGKLALEKEGLQKDFQEARTDAKDSVVASETRFTHEKERFQRDLRRLEDAKKADEQTLTDRFNDGAQIAAKKSARLGEELSNAKRELKELQASLQKSECERTKILEQAANDLETHKQVAAQKMEEKLKVQIGALRTKLEEKKKQEIEEIRRQLVDGAQERERLRKANQVSHSRFSQRSTEDLAAMATQTLASRDSRSRRRVNRHEQSNRPPTASNVGQPVVISSDSTGSTFPNRLGDLEHLDETGVALRRPETMPDTKLQVSRPVPQSQSPNRILVPETQNTVVLDTQCTTIPETQDSVTHDMLLRSSTSDLTSPPKTSSPENLNLKNERALITPTGRDPRHHPQEGKANKNTNLSTSTGFVADGRPYSLESPVHPRPTSQANTGSRMVAPINSAFDKNKSSKGLLSPLPRDPATHRHSHVSSGQDVSAQAPSSSTKLPKLKFNVTKKDGNGARISDHRGVMLPHSVDTSGLKRKEAPARVVHETPKRVKETPSNPPSSVSHKRAPSVARSGHVQVYGQARGPSHSVATSVTRQGFGSRRKSRLLCLSVWG